MNVLSIHQFVTNLLSAPISLVNGDVVVPREQVPLPELVHLNVLKTTPAPALSVFKEKYAKSIPMVALLVSISMNATRPLQTEVMLVLRQILNASTPTLVLSATVSMVWYLVPMVSTLVVTIHVSLPTVEMALIVSLANALMSMNALTVILRALVLPIQIVKTGKVASPVSVTMVSLPTLTRSPRKSSGANLLVML